MARVQLGVTLSEADTRDIVAFSRKPERRAAVNFATARFFRQVPSCRRNRGRSARIGMA